MRLEKVQDGARGDPRIGEKLIIGGGCEWNCQIIHPTWANHLDLLGRLIWKALLVKVRLRIIGEGGEDVLGRQLGLKGLQHPSHEVTEDHIGERIAWPGAMARAYHIMLSWKGKKRVSMQCLDGSFGCSLHAREVHCTRLKEVFFEVMHDVVIKMQTCCNGGYVVIIPMAGDCKGSNDPIECFL